ncbi:CRTAC1 family protein [Elongatibacter sediminis]|uniref:CRTAC1 family protein n=1 Tax=Elongatibacter sediminis TaxID=3119006 RepID=A0AAW9RFI7_9GAMM
MTRTARQIRLRRFLLLPIGTLLLAWVPAAVAQWAFEEVSLARGLGGYAMAVGPVGGAAAADYDNDGDIDLFVPTAEGKSDLLFRNDGSGQFSDVSNASGFTLTHNHRAALWFDFDGDHLLDLVVGGDCRTDPLSDGVCEQTENLRLYRQRHDHTFEDVTDGSGLEASWGGRANAHRSGLAAGDIDNDGWLDLYVNDWNGRAWLYRNDRDGSFTDVTVAAGLTDQTFEHHQAIFYDFNGDGWQDIYVAVDFFTPNFLWINQGDGTFVDRSQEAGTGNAMTDMGIALGDYDNDGDMDLYVTNITRNGDHNVFLRNDSTGNALAFTEIAEAVGVDEGYWGWGTTFLDADNDGWLDLAATNGQTVGQWSDDPSLFYRNLANDPVSFEDVSEAVGFDDTFIGASLIAFDHDRDGDLDLLQTAQGVGDLQLLDNQPDTAASQRHYLVVRPRMPGNNHFAIGAQVHVTAGPLQLMRAIRAGTSTLGQEPAEAFFGLGPYDHADEVRVVWPDGRQTVMGEVAAGQVVTVESESPFTINAGLNDAWFNPDTSGQGFFVTVLPALGKVFLAWFTYDTERPDAAVQASLGGPGQRWLTAFGDYAGHQAVLDIEVTRGGVFDAGSPSPTQQPDGEIVLEFSSCSAGTVSYDIPSIGRKGVVPIQRLASDNVARCEAAVVQ